MFLKILKSAGFYALHIFCIACMFICLKELNKPDLRPPINKAGVLIDKYAVYPKENKECDCNSYYFIMKFDGKNDVERVSVKMQTFYKFKLNNRVSLDMKNVYTPFEQPSWLPFFAILAVVGLLWTAAYGIVLLIFLIQIIFLKNWEMGKFLLYL